MGRMKFIFSAVLLCLVWCTSGVRAQYITKYPEIPRIDVHAHLSDNYQLAETYLALRDRMLQDHKIDLAMWVNLGGENEMENMALSGKGRIMNCLSDYSPHKGLKHKAEDIEAYKKQGLLGFKIWHGPYYRVLKEGEEGIKYIDDPAHEPVFAALEKTGMPGASIHIADPNGPFGNRGKWLVDPIEYWREIIGLERVLQRHPDLVLLAAHCAWLICQDAQIDFLRYMLITYPNFYIDLAATFQYYHLVNQENLRDFMLEFSDRILYGTDISKFEVSAIPNTADGYCRTFRILETDEQVEGGFFSRNPTQGLNLPKEVLEKIYYKNALKIYSALSDRMLQLGYAK